MRKNTKKIAAIGVSCLIASGLLLGSVEYASHTFAAAQTVATGAKLITEKVVENTEAKITSSGISKEETVYATLDASGKKQNVIVSDWLKNSGVNANIKDVSNLTDIENTKGNEKFTQDNSNLSWDAKDKDIYYQGTTKEDIPVGMEIVYKLDGKEMKPEDLAGKSGKLEMSIKYTNSSKKTISVSGKDYEVYTPFVMATGMILPVEKFKNITIDNGEVVSEGDNDVIMAYGMPGLKETLDLDNIDFGDDVDLDTKKITKKITDTVTITADVENFSMGKIYTAATPSVFKDIDFDNVSDEDELNDKMDDLKDASKKLVDGSDKINDGLDKLESNFDKYSDAITKLKGSVKTLKDGGNEINAATKKYTSSTDKLLGAVDKYADGAKKFAGSTKTYSTNTKKLVDGVGKLYTATSGFPKSYNEFDSKLTAYTTGVNTLLSKDNMDQLTGATTALKNGVEKVDAGAKAVKGGIDQINQTAQKLEKTNETEACIQGLTAIKTQYASMAESASDAATKAQYQQLAAAAAGAITYMESAQKAAAAIDAYTNGKADGDVDASGAKDLAAGMSQIIAATDTTSKTENLYTGLTALDTSANEIAKNAETLRGYKDPILTASGTVKEGVNNINTNLNKIYKSGSLLTSNNKKLNEAGDALSTNAGLIKKNSKKLTGSSNEFRNATKKMAEGTGKLFSGVTTLATKTGQVSSGIGKLASGASDLYDGAKKFQKDGANKLANTVTDLLDGTDELQNKAKAINKASKSYTSFSGISDDMDGSVKFIMTTSEIKAKDK